MRHLIMQANCLFHGGTATGIITAPHIYVNTTATCDSGGKYAEYMIILPLSQKVNYTCKFQNLVRAGDAVSAITVLRSHSK